MKTNQIKKKATPFYVTIPMVRDMGNRDALDDGAAGARSARGDLLRLHDTLVRVGEDVLRAYNSSCQCHKRSIPIRQENSRKCRQRTGSRRRADEVGGAVRLRRRGERLRLLLALLKRAQARVL
jgi:hypothetical protein